MDDPLLREELDGWDEVEELDEDEEGVLEGARRRADDDDDDEGWAEREDDGLS